MADPEPTWLVLVRDVSQSIRVRGQSHLTACLVLDVGSGLVHGLAIAATEADALDQALRAALGETAGPLPPARPKRVLCGPDLAASVTRAFGAMSSRPRAPVVSEVEPNLEAEDIFDSFLAHMGGRTQPDEFAAPEDWQLLFDQALRFLRDEPWIRWSDDIDLALDITVDGQRARYVAVVMGNAGVQHGLVLYPGESAPPGLRDEHRDGPDAMPAGTLVCTLDRPGELPAELTAKAHRYGWPPGADVVPAFFTVGPSDGRDVGRADVRRLTVALAAVLSHDGRGPVLVHPAPPSVTEVVALAHGEAARFTIFQRPASEKPAPVFLQVHRVGVDLVPVGTSVVLGHLSWSALSNLQATARLRAGAPTDAPAPAGKEVPLVVIVPEGGAGDTIAAKLAGLLPYAVTVVDTDDGEAVVAVVGKDGAELLMEVAGENSGVAAFRRRLRQTKGRHVLMVADQATASGQGTVYGLFEFHQELPPGKKSPSPPPGKKSPSPRPRAKRPRDSRR
ncbi:MAG: hypothetical protein ACRDY1_12990 [Acidimicrobiales bacterium]